MAVSESTLEGKLRQASSLIESTNESAEELKVRDRSKIAKLVIWLYAIVVLACFIFVLGGLWFLEGCSETPASGCFAWKEPADYLLQVLTTAVLPIVTLVLGYYFGTAKVNGSTEG